MTYPSGEQLWYRNGQRIYQSDPGLKPVPPDPEDRTRRQR
jgi:hypothetical protein